MRTRSAYFSGGYLSLGSILVALTALLFTQVYRSTGAQDAQSDGCPALPAFAVSLPAGLPSPIAASPTPSGTAAVAAASAIVSGSPAAATAASTASAAVTDTLVPSTPAPPSVAVPIRTLFRADDPPLPHGIEAHYGAAMPLVLTTPCQAPPGPRPRTAPCVKLLPPAAELCATGIAGAGRLGSDDQSPAFALQSGRVTLSDVDGAVRLDDQQAFVRFDDAGHGLQLFCATVPLVEVVSSNARRFVALCDNRGVAGWAISGQITDGGGASPDSLSLVIDAPDGERTTVTGNLFVGAIVVRDLPDPGSP